MNPETEEKIYFYTEDLQVGYGGKQILNPVRIGIKTGITIGTNGLTRIARIAANVRVTGGA